MEQPQIPPQPELPFCYFQGQMPQLSCFILTLSPQTLLVFHMEPRRPWGKCYFYSPATLSCTASLKQGCSEVLLEFEWDILAAEASAHANSSNSSPTNTFTKSERLCASCACPQQHFHYPTQIPSSKLHQGETILQAWLPWQSSLVTGVVTGAVRAAMSLWTGTAGME